MRPWQHVLEPLAGYLQLGLQIRSNPTRYCTSWNFGPYSQDEIRVSDVVNEAIRVWGRGTFKNLGSLDQPHEAKLLRLDIQRTVAEIAWRPFWDAKKAIKFTIEWYIEAQKPVDHCDLLKKYINHYCNSGKTV